MIQKLLSSLLVIVLTAAPAAADVDPAVIAAEADRVNVVETISAPTIAVFGQGGSGGGSGVVITTDGYALTNFHVTKPSGNAMKCGMNDGKFYDAVIVGIDPTGDVALIKLLGRDDFPTAELGDSDDVRVGDWAFAVGNPFLLATDFTPTVSYGIISGVHRYQYPAGTLLEYADCIQTDAAINPGNSGGPLFSAAGQLIGINGRGSFEKRGRVNVGVGYAISINQIKNFMGYLRSGRIVDHATLGATVGTDEDGRVVVYDILAGSDAFRRGLRLDDEIVRFGGRNIRTVNGFKNVLGVFPKGWRIPLTFRREGHTYDIHVRLTGTHRDGQLVELVAGRPKQVPMPEPKPKDRGEEGDNKDKPDIPRIKQFPVHKPKPMPPAVKKLFEAKRGYANYYFNRLNQQRVWDSYTGAADFAGLPPTWNILGTIDTEADQGAAKITLSATAGKAELPGFIANAAFDDDLTDTLDPPATGGLLVALHLWQRLLTRGLDDFGDVYYLGTAPMPGQDDLVDVLVGIHAGVEGRFCFAPDSGRLVALEMFADADLDPCEIYFHDYEESFGRLLPTRWVIKNGDRQYGVLRVAEYLFDKGTE